MNQNSVGADRLLGNTAQLFVRSVHGVARLKSDNLAPSSLRYVFTNLGGGPKCIGKIGLEIGIAEHLDLPRYYSIPHSAESGDSRMLRIRRTKTYVQ